MISLQINGQTRELEIDTPASLQAALDHLGIQGDRVAVEWNGEIVARKIWGTSILQTGDRLEIVHFVGGGSDGASLRPTATIQNMCYRT